MKCSWGSQYSTKRQKVPMIRYLDILLERNIQQFQNHLSYWFLKSFSSSSKIITIIMNHLLPFYKKTMDTFLVEPHWIWFKVCRSPMIQVVSIIECLLFHNIRAEVERWSSVGPRSSLYSGWDMNSNLKFNSFHRVPFVVQGPAFSCKDRTWP